MHESDAGSRAIPESLIIEHSHICIEPEFKSEGLERTACKWVLNKPAQ